MSKKYTLVGDLIRRIFVLVGVLMLMLVLVVPAMAASPESSPPIPVNAQVVFEKDPITDLGLLLERAKGGITDFAGDKAIGKITGPPGAIVKEYVTTQKVKELRWNGGGLDRYVTSAFFLVALPESNSTDVGILAADTTTITDPSYSYTLYLELNYDNQWDVNGNVFGKILSVKGKWTRLDSQVTAQNAKLMAGANGPTLSGGYNVSKLSEKSIGYPTSGSTYTITPPDWGYTKYQASDGGTILDCYIAGGARSTLVRGGTTWSLDADIIKGDMSGPW